MVTLRADGVCVLVDVSGGVPRVLHWGRDVDVVDSDTAFLAALAEPHRGADALAGSGPPSVLPEQSTGYMGTPGIDGHRDGTSFSTLFRPEGCEVVTGPDGAQTLTARAVDPETQLGLVTTLELSLSGVLRMRAALTNTATDGGYAVDGIRMALPVPPQAQELLDFAGRHLRERTPQRRPFLVGTHLREGRRGRTGSDAALLLVAGAPGFTFRTGEVWAVHTAWSGNHATYAELGLAGDRVLGGGELLLPGEVVLASGETYTSPWLYGVHGEGLDEVASRLHRQLRSRPTHPRSPRPVVLNTWEAVYFAHDLSALVDLARLAARVGAERFVLDDGWFLHRRNDTAGLGDWTVDRAVWPEGLGPLVEAVRGLDMQFGLWFEPEMVNEDSDLARAHPDWVLAPGSSRLPVPGRNQQVLNLSIPEAFAHVLEAMSALVAEHSIDYVKWDHNRDLAEAGDRVTGSPRVHAQTLAVYALMDELRRRHPHLEIESCSSGGGRVDLEILQRTDRVWASDCIDPLERQRIQRWTGLLLPPELVGAHVGSPTAHTTDRTSSLGFRAGTALFGHFGIEWDLRTASAAELEELAAWVSLYKQERDLIHSGAAVHADPFEETYSVHGYVSQAGDRAIFAFVAMDTSLAPEPGRVRLPGLRPDVRYHLEPVELSGGALVRTPNGPPTWWAEPTVVSGSVLSGVGLRAPMLYPQQALLLRLTSGSA